MQPLGGQRIQVAITRQELFELPQQLFESLQELVASVFRDAGVVPRYVQQIGRVHSLLALIDAGLGVALVPRSASSMRLPGLEFLEVDGPAPDIVGTHAVWRTANEDPALRALLRFVRR